MLVDRSGVRCDLTGIILSGDFAYYSVTGRKVHVIGATATPGKEVGIDLDICESAFQSIVDQCRKFIGVATTGFKCEMSGHVASGEYDYWHMVFDKISVPSSKADPKSGEVPIEVINGVLDLNICPEEGEKLLETKGTWRKAPMPS